MREKIMPPLVLTLICVIISGLLVLANAATKDKIAQAQQDKLNTSLEALFGEGIPLWRICTTMESPR